MATEIFLSYLPSNTSYADAATTNPTQFDYNLEAGSGSDASIVGPQIVDDTGITVSITPAQPSALLTQDGSDFYGPILGTATFADFSLFGGQYLISAPTDIVGLEEGEKFVFHSLSFVGRSNDEVSGLGGNISFSSGDNQFSVDLSAYQSGEQFTVALSDFDISLNEAATAYAILVDIETTDNSLLIASTGGFFGAEKLIASAVPLPESLPLLLFGLVSLSAARRFRI